MTHRTLMFVAAGGSAALLAGAFLFQYLGWAPCKMCLWQRWPHAAAVAIGFFALLIGPSRVLALLGALATAATAGIGAYHSGVELKWWEGPASCSGAGSGLQGLSGSSLVPGTADAAPLVMCDTLTPFFAGLTMANWNMIASLGLLVLWALALRKSA